MVYLCFFLTCVCTLFVSTYQKSVLDIACLYPYESPRFGFESKASFDAIELAVKHINENPNVLPNYTLRVSYKNSGCDPIIGLQNFFEFLREPNRNYLTILGPLCSTATGPVAELAAFYGLPLVTFASTSPSLTDNLRYPLLLLGTPSDINTVSGQLLVIRQQNFRRIAIINQRAEIFVSIGGRLETFLDELDVVYTTEIFDSLADDYLDSLELILSRLQTDGFRVIVANMYEVEFVNMLCLLRKFPNLQSPMTTWIVLGWYVSIWSEDVHKLTNGVCTREEIIAVSNGSLAVNPSLRFEDYSLANTTTISGYSPAQLFDLYLEAVKSHKDEFLKTVIYDAFAYDCTWTIALALNELPASRNLSTTRVNSNELFSNMRRTKFVGWTGNVSYFNRERHNGRIQLMEIINGKFNFRGLFVNLPLNQSILATYNNWSFKQAFPFIVFNPASASDGIEIHYFYKSIFALTLILSLFGAGYVTVLITIIYFGWLKKYAAVTKSEPSVNIVILVGGYSNFLLAILWSIDGRYLECSINYSLCTFMCHFRIWLLAVSFSIIFGGMLGKAIKYYIIPMKCKFSKYLQFYHALFPPIILTMIDTLYMVIWGLTFPISYISSFVNSGQSNPTIFEISNCMSQDGSHYIIFISILVVFKAGLVTIGLFLAYHLRKVVNKANKYSSVITWTMYNVLIFFITIVLLLFLVQNVDIKYGLVCLFSMINGFAVSSIVAGPVIYYMCKDPHGKTFGGMEGVSEDPQQLKAKIRTLESENKDMKGKIEESTITTA